MITVHFTSAEPNISPRSNGFMPTSPLAKTLDLVYTESKRSFNHRARMHKGNAAVNRNSPRKGSLVLGRLCFQGKNS